MKSDSDATPYDRLGGEARLRELVERFYDLMDLEPGYAALRRAHPGTLENGRARLFKFLSGWLGGPPLYTDEFGHPMLRARHLSFANGPTERDQWMACMAQAMEELGVDELLRLQLHGALFKTADWMRNRPDGESPPER
jgi:hemoglobin